MGQLDISQLLLRYEDDEGAGFELQIPALNIKEGEFFTLLGKSGCGKTTLLKVIAGLEPLEQGDVLVNGQSMGRIPAEKRGIGMVFQDSLLFPHMNVLKNVCFGLKMAKISKDKAVAMAQEALSSVGLEGYEARMPEELSGGQQQRVSMARSIVTKPQILLMDEPFSSLDPGLRAEMRNLIRSLHRHYAMTIIFVTHDVDEAFQISDRIALMERGRIVQMDTPEALFNKPDRLDVVQFMGPVNLIEGMVEGYQFRSGDWVIPLLEHYAKSSKTLVIRPEDVRLKAHGDNGDDTYAFPCEIRTRMPRRGYDHYLVDVQGVPLKVIERSIENPDLQPGSKGYACLESSRLLLMDKEV